MINKLICKSNQFEKVVETVECVKSVVQSNLVIRELVIREKWGVRHFRKRVVLPF